MINPATILPPTLAGSILAQAIHFYEGPDVVFAILDITCKNLAPYLNEHKAELERHFTAAVGHPVTVQIRFGVITAQGLVPADTRTIKRKSESELAYESRMAARQRRVDKVSKSAFLQCVLATFEAEIIDVQVPYRSEFIDYEAQ